MAGLQALSLAWDSRPKDKGGQRWFHLYPDEEIKHDDVLHWTRLNQNWNFMCAGCHSTGVRKNYDAATDRFATSFAEISVGCEACHGQGSRHVGWASAQQSWWPFGKSEDPRKGLLVRFDERDDVVWPIDPSTGNARRNFTPALVRKEVETCGLCHARRGEFSEDWVPGRWLSDTHAVSPLARGLYSADGQMLDEVYDYGSFKQSRMFAAGVTCGDCHEPHGAKLRAPGDGVCLQCHAAGKYAAVAHSRHAAADPALACASCHMPARTYMVVDKRHDHSFRIPRPDLSVKLGTPNACNDCHRDQPATWAAAAVETWHGPNRKGFQRYARGLPRRTDGPSGCGRASGRRGGGSEPPGTCTGDRPERAWSRTPRHRSSPWRGPASADPDPMVRIGAARHARKTCLRRSFGRWFRRCYPIPIAACACGLPPCSLRSRPPASLPPTGHASSSAAAEFIAAQRLNADRPEARSALGRFLRAARPVRAMPRLNTRPRCV